MIRRDEAAAHFEGEVTARRTDTKRTHLVMKAMVYEEEEEERDEKLTVGVVVCLGMLSEAVVECGGVYGTFMETDDGVLRTSVQEDVDNLEMLEGTDDGDGINFLGTFSVQDGALQTTTGHNNTTCSIWEALEARESDDLNINSQPTQVKIINPGTT